MTEPVALQCVALASNHVLAVPGRHEARALTDWCPRCTQPTLPASVLDADGGRHASYRCPVCAFAWLCWWARPTS
jgi:hypothetical protein